MNNFITSTIQISKYTYCCYVDPELGQWFSDVCTFLSFSAQKNMKQNVFNKIIIRTLRVGETPQLVGLDTSENWYIYRHNDLYKIWANEKKSIFILELNKKFLRQRELKYIGIINLFRILFKQFTYSGGGLIHAGLALNNCKGFLFAGAGGTGKTTCIRRLPKGSWRPLCDDTSLLIRNNNIITVCPTVTWSDLILGDNKNIKYDLSLEVPLKAVFFLRQAKKCSCERINKTLSMINLYQSQIQCWHHYTARLSPMDQKKFDLKIWSTAKDIANMLPCYLLDVSLTGDFLELVQEV